METQGTDDFGVKSKTDNGSSGATNSESSSASSTDSAESHCSTSTSHGMGGIASKPHKANDANWQAINLLKSRQPNIGLSNFRLLKRVGAGDIGTVYLAQLKGTTCQFAIKVMDKESLRSRKKLMRAHTEREILALLDHPFLPTMYTYFETETFLCIVMEYCSGGDLHNLRQKQPKKHFSESAARFYASEVLVALEYLHMMGIVYRDLKPENVLVKAGHIMLSDFDLSLRCNVSPTLLVRSASCCELTETADSDDVEADLVTRSCMSHPCLFPRLLTHKKKSREKSSSSSCSSSSSASEWGAPEILAEPSSARSMSFVGTHEYLAPEIIKGEGHGSAVDWWTYGILLYELLHGRTPFKGETNHATLLNVVRQPLRFPDTPAVSGAARDLIRGLLEKDPRQRLACAMGASQIKHHPFFQGVNWALIRAAPPPPLPQLNSPSPSPSPSPAPAAPPQNEPRRRRSPTTKTTVTAPSPPVFSAAPRRSPTRPRSQSQSGASTPVSVCTSDDYYIDFTNLY